MSRDDLLNVNFNIMKAVTEQVVKYSPNCIIVPVANPLDAMCQAVYKLSGFPRERVIGMAGVLDSARMRTFIAQELKVSVENVHAFVLGGHGDTMVPLPRLSTVAGIPITQLLSKERIEAICKRTADGGAEITKLVGTSAWYAPGESAAEMVEAILKDKKKILPCSAYLEGEYGVKGQYLGVPVKLGASGHRADHRSQAGAGRAGGADEVGGRGQGAGGRNKDVGLKGSESRRSHVYAHSLPQRARVLPHHLRDVRNRDQFRADSLAFAFVRAVSEAFGFHLLDHAHDPALAFGLSLGQQRQMGDLGAREQMRRRVLAGRHARAAADARRRVHGRCLNGPWGRGCCSRPARRRRRRKCSRRPR